MRSFRARKRGSASTARYVSAGAPAAARPRRTYVGRASAASAQGSRARGGMTPLPAHALRVRAALAGRGARPYARPGSEDGANAGEEKLDRVLRVLRRGMRLPGVGLQNLAAEQHAVAAQARWDPELCQARVSDPGSEEHGSGLELRASGPGLRLQEAVGLHRVVPRRQPALELGQEPGLRPRVRIHHHEGVGRIRLGQHPLHRPLERVTLSAKLRNVPDQHIRAGTRTARPLLGVPVAATGRCRQQAATSTSR
jgi:hypothetical protein